MTTLPAGGSETILLAEDDDEVRKIMKTILERFGYTVIDAIDGDDACRKFSEHRDSVRLLVLDVIMPRRSGRDVYDYAREMNPAIKVLFTSGYTADIVLKKGVPVDVFPFLPKPASPQDLLKKVRQILDGTASAGRAPA
ncbi:MAG TPA: response regulator [Dissulfurispiraceae bacterium]|nr:response regulator [Dissulfurispiraceae bacterium]